MRALAVMGGVLWSMFSWASPEGEQGGCEAGMALGDRLEAIESAIVDDELTVARQKVIEALESLNCLTEVVDSASLSGIWQASAAIEFFGASETAALRDMSRAKAIPGGTFRTRLGVDLERQWVDAIPELSATLEVASVPSDFGLYVNGSRCLQPALQLPSGPHVVQVVEGDTLRFHRLVHLNHGQTALVETHLSPEPPSASASSKARTVLLWSGLASGGLALGSYGLAVASDRQMQEGRTKAEIESLRDQSLRYRNASWALAATATLGIGFHGFF